MSVSLSNMNSNSNTNFSNKPSSRWRMTEFEQHILYSTRAVLILVILTLWYRQKLIGPACQKTWRYISQENKDYVIGETCVATPQSK